MIRKFLTPFQNFIKIESLSGLLLVVTTAIALICANSSANAFYYSILHYELGITLNTFNFTKPVILWVNDGLMVIFFFLIGLEIKRELLIGELNSIRKAAFPLVGAIGGMLVPVVLFLILNQNPETQDAWGIPMATDIAFSLAVLNSLGKRVPLSLKIFLSAFAIVDDIGAVLIIALFYSSSLNIMLLLVALLILIIMYFLSYRGIYSTVVLTFAGITVWFLFLKAGIHPTIAGILLAFAVPVRQSINTSTFLESIQKVYEDIKRAPILKKPVLSNQQLQQVENLEYIVRTFRSPLQSLEDNLHGLVAYFIIPVFALANAGIGLQNLTTVDNFLVFNIAICLVLGKGVGVSLIVLWAKKFKWITVPDNIDNRQIIGVSFLAGIGFTMAIFIGNLAFTSEIYLNSAKIGILIGSAIAAIVGFIILRSKPQII
ncbi:Na+/H+ antiporter NhaA [Leeuwenhoekiella sp. A16]|uniref:Na+/H+ antiporter NhaA n=1 Tax=unclassified Leeuwenhoekiella TaxID=2615029 RepID=UPI003A809B9A|tara:strand:- start:685 stop:1977 length:1293 start_codon:yes stop_codon:yes gene_type:complete